jgi:hypothetical protein
MLVLLVKPKPGVRPFPLILYSHYIEFISHLSRKHLIVSIGGECYVTLAKGQIIPSDSAAVPGGGHVLIIPISHHPTYSTIPPDLAPPIVQETDK